MEDHTVETRPRDGNDGDGPPPKPGLDKNAKGKKETEEPAKDQPS